MRETDFIAKNKDKWAKYEKALAREQQDPELLKELYTHTTDDLSYARTFYPNRTVRVYLNGLARRTFLQLNRNRRTKIELFVNFWTDELPRILYTRRQALLIALLFFVLAMLIGILSYRIDQGFAELILGQGYVDMTKEFIRSGDPMAVYKQRSPIDMFLTITLNNIYVALQVFIMGVFFAIGSVVILVQNGIMLGVFQYFFVEKGLFWESFLTIWIHGALEISSIVIAGAAGLTMGSGLLFPGTYTRLQAFGRSARDGLKIMLGTIPLFVIAGFLESYLTRHTEVADVLRFFFILSCFAFILWYYWLYPRQVAGRPPSYTTTNYRSLQTRETAPIPTQSIKTLGALLTDTFLLLGRAGTALLGKLALSSLAFCVLVAWFSSQSLSNRFLFSGRSIEAIYNLYVSSSTFGFDRDATFFLLLTLLLAAVLLQVFRAFDRLLGLETTRKNWQRLAIPLLLLALLFSLPGFWVFWLVIACLPCLLLYAYVAYRGVGNFPMAAGYTYRYFASSYGLFILLFLLVYFSIFILDTAVSRLIFSAISWLVATDPSSLYTLDVFLQLFLYTFFFTLLLTAWLGGTILHFHSTHERETATGLRAKIEQLGKDRRLRGLEVE